MERYEDLLQAIKDQMELVDGETARALARRARDEGVTLSGYRAFLQLRTRRPK